MKRYAVLVAFAVLAIAVPFAQSSPSGTPQRLAKLEKQVRVLRAQMKTVRLQVACINGVAGVTSYGVPSNSEGYKYQRAGTPPSEIITTGVDFTQQGETPQVLVAAVNPKCVTARSSYSAGARKRSGGTKVTLLRLHAAR
jgi:hypothetical protein